MKRLILTFLVLSGTNLLLAQLPAFYDNTFITVGNSRLGRDLHLQNVGAPENGWTRSIISNRFFWDNDARVWTRAPFVIDNGTAKYQPDFSMFRFNNNGISLFTAQIWNDKKLTFTDQELEQYQRMFINSDGQVGIGANSSLLALEPNYKLIVDGRVLCEELKIELSQNWGDFVFEDNYELMSLEEIETYIKENKHLPGIEAANELEEGGVELGEMLRKQMIKIEELTLHTINQQKLIEEQAALINTLIENQSK